MSARNAPHTTAVTATVLLLDPYEDTRSLYEDYLAHVGFAAAAVDGIVLEPGETFSFWSAAGRPSRNNGYVIGRELRSGCMIPAVGGRICQLTNALSRVAHAAGMARARPISVEPTEITTEFVTCFI